MPKVIKNLYYFLIALLLLIPVDRCLALSLITSDGAEGMKTYEEKFRGAAGFSSETSIEWIVRAVIEGFLILLSLIFIILIIIAGYNWMTAAGEENKVTKAKDTIRRAIIGLIIIIAAYGITYFVFNILPWG